MRMDCIRRGLFVAGLCAVFPLKEAGAGPAKGEVQPAGAKKTAGFSGKGGSEGKTVVSGEKGAGKPSATPLLSARPDSAAVSGKGAVADSGAKVSKGGGVPKTAVPGAGGGQPAAGSSQKMGSQKFAGAGGKPVGVKGVVLPKLEAFQPQQPEQPVVEPLKKGEELDELKWTRFSTGRDDYFPVLRVLACNAPLVRQVTEMRLAMDVGYPRRPPKLPKIVVELPRSGSAAQAPVPESKGVSGPESDAAIEFFSEPATRTGGDIGMETVVIPLFRVAQPPPIPPVQSRANLRQE